MARSARRAGATSLDCVTAPPNLMHSVWFPCAEIGGTGERLPHDQGARRGVGVEPQPDVLGDAGRVAVDLVGLVVGLRQ